MGACATKPGDLKVKGEAPLVEEDAAAPQAAADEKAKADVLPVAAAEVDQADVSRRRSLSVLLKQDAEASDGEADHQEAEKVMADEEPASAAAAGETMGSPQATTEHDDTAEELKDDDLPSGDAQAAEEEKRVDPESVQVAVAAVTDAAADAPSSEESKVADDNDASA
ncbi:uncharacterized protein [Miscanthus floridulus]|uniref:uncharacterized protein n=1 Tax=Miscanthus floridulus TaxID=154761 RepID=UPI0034580D30